MIDRDNRDQLVAQAGGPGDHGLNRSSFLRDLETRKKMRGTTMHRKGSRKTETEGITDKRCQQCSARKYSELEKPQVFGVDFRYGSVTVLVLSSESGERKTPWELNQQGPQLWVGGCRRDQPNSLPWTVCSLVSWPLGSLPFP